MHRTDAERRDAGKGQVKHLLESVFRLSGKTLADHIVNG